MMEPLCENTPFVWPFKRGGILTGVEINTFMLRFTLSFGLSRGVIFQEGSTIYTCIHIINIYNFMIR